MGCSGQRYVVTRTVWSNQSTSTGVFHSFVRVPVGKWGRARLSVVMEGSSGDLTVESAGVYADEEADFASGTAVSIPTTPTSIAADGNGWGASFATLDATRQMVDFGVNAKNTSGSTIASGRVTLMVEVAE